MKIEDLRKWLNWLVDNPLCEIGDDTPIRWGAAWPFFLALLDAYEGPRECTCTGAPGDGPCDGCWLRNTVEKLMEEL